MELCKFVHEHSQRVLYYPACGEDWEPLYQLSRYCDVFVYCDILHPTRKKVDGKVGTVPRDSAWLEAEFCEIHKRTSAGDRLQIQEVKELESCQCPENFELKPFGSWAKLVTLTLKENGVIRPLKLVYIKGYGEILYRTLFYNKSIAPRIICLRHPAQGAQMRLRDGGLGQMVINGVCKPEFIVTHYPLIGCYDWGWNQVVQREFDGWDNLPSSINKNFASQRELNGYGRVSLLARPA